MTSDDPDNGCEGDYMWSSWSSYGKISSLHTEFCGNWDSSHLTHENTSKNFYRGKSSGSEISKTEPAGPVDSQLTGL